MDKYHSCLKEDLKLESPFRLLIVGPMSSGKSTFLTNFINSLYDNVSNSKNFMKTSITLIRYVNLDYHLILYFNIYIYFNFSDIDTTVEKLGTICKEHNYDFQNLKGVPDWGNLIDLENNSHVHSILILEDLRKNVQKYNL